MTCPKCGDPEGQWTGPKYMGPTLIKTPDRSRPDRVVVRTTRTKECLRYTCAVCGYVRTTPCVASV